MAHVTTEPLRPSRGRWSRKIGASLLLVLVAGGASLWWVTDWYRRSKLDQKLIAMQGLDRTLDLRISNVREKQRLTDSPPYYSPGGTWAVFDCSPASGGEGSITVALDTAPHPAAWGPRSIYDTVLIPSDREAARKFVSALAAGLRHELPAESFPEPLVVVKVDAEVVGEHLGTPESGFMPGKGNWVATNWYIGQEGNHGMVGFNFDLTSRRATFSEKGNEYGELVLPLFAAAVRDGPRPPRSPANDPTFTNSGPRVVDLKSVPNSDGFFPEFGRGGRVLVLTRNSPSGSVRIVPLETPEKPVIAETFSGFVSAVICEDPNGNELLVFDGPVWGGVKGVPSTGSYHLWRVNRELGRRREIKFQGCEIDSAAYPYDRALSPDGRYLMVKRWASPRGANNSISIPLCVIDLKTEQLIQIDSPRADLIFACWAKGLDGSAQVVLAVDDHSIPSDRIPSGEKYVADPKTGVVTEMPSPPLRTPDQLISPDGRLQLSIHPHEALDVINVASGKIRTFSFRQEDQRFVDERMFKWLNERYVAYSMSFIDVESMKEGDLPTAVEGTGTHGYSFSPDFKWAYTWLDGISLGRVVLPE